MKVDKIIPCVCCDHEPDCGDSVYYGMPQLKVCGGKPHTYFEVYCPNCGRGGLIQYKSAYLALKGWNELQCRARRRGAKWLIIDTGGDKDEDRN